MLLKVAAQILLFLAFIYPLDEDFNLLVHWDLFLKINSQQHVALQMETAHHVLGVLQYRERTYLRYYGLLGQRFCMINKVYQENFEKFFVQQYSMMLNLSHVDSLMSNVTG